MTENPPATGGWLSPGLVRYSGSVRPTPFPWQELPRIDSAVLELERRGAAWAQREFDLGQLGPALRELFGVELQGFGVRRHRVNAAEPASLGADVQLQSEGCWLGLSVEPALAASLIGRAVNQHVPLQSNAPLNENLRGAFSAVAVEVCRRLARTTPLGISQRRASGPVWVLDCWLRVDGASYRVRASIVLERVASAPRGMRRSSTLPIRLPLVLASASARPRELASLRVGDAFAFGSPLPEGLLGTTAALCAARSERGLQVVVEARGMVLQGPCDLGYDGQEVTMATEERRFAEDDNTVEDTIADAPVVVRVELGTVCLSAGAWLSLSPGDVVTSEIPIGAPALLRVAGQVVAEGELVNVEGRVAVKIAKLRD